MFSWILTNSDLIQGQRKYEKGEEDIMQITKTFVTYHAEGYLLHSRAIIVYRTIIPTDRAEQHIQRAKTAAATKA